ncbi:hypothetical protein FA04_14565 [Ensifer adhaerens]|uniref:Uncharacterized protein n=1 Tax=Ensifer adhaerens TaxID=106592 RepID=A0ABY8HE94_ENSAD|nr:hypothetical protein [Ensifer adhaerens]ANK73735.1 hypothetical protein FA04_14565 [Ensifer adhaerens]KDP70303.1 hypothetical protein FA04_29145 [Ensifer adhaerens]WFP89819.1 hypothetical protein P4B07_14795 [Ensifer adhaerens]
MARNIKFIAQAAAGQEAVARNIEHCSRLGLPLITQSGPVAHRLAVVGGSPWAKDYLDELRTWDGEIWGVNGAFGWCIDHGVDATFYTIDPAESLKDMAIRAKRAVLASCCHPEVFAAVDGPIEVFPLGELPNGSTSASTAPMGAAVRGHAHVTFFGCESSFETQIHGYDWASQDTSRAVVVCGGQEYLTTPQLIMQAEYIAEIARALPFFINVRGRGFLPALIEHGDYEVLKVSRAIMESLGNGNQQLH